MSTSINHNSLGDDADLGDIMRHLTIAIALLVAPLATACTADTADENTEIATMQAPLTDMGEQIDRLSDVTDELRTEVDRATDRAAADAEVDAYRDRATDIVDTMIDIARDLRSCSRDGDAVDVRETDRILSDLRDVVDSVSDANAHDSLSDQRSDVSDRRADVARLIDALRDDHRVLSREADHYQCTTDRASDRVSDRESDGARDGARDDAHDGPSDAPSDSAPSDAPSDGAAD